MDDPKPAAPLLDEAYLFTSLMASSGDSIYVKDRDCHLVQVSSSMARSLGFASPADLVGLTDYDLFGADFAARTMVEDRRIMETDKPLIGLVESRPLEGGGTNWTLTSKMPLHDAAGAVIGLIGTTGAINDLKQAESNLQHLATHDSLTGLPNRYLMADRLNQVIHGAARQQSTFGLLFVDVDDFKLVNDERGHAAGDEVLRSLGERLQACVRNSDTVARFGGDEFVSIVEGVDQQHAEKIGRKLVETASTPIHAGQGTAKITISVGLAMYPEHGIDAATLLTAADHAMYLAKQAGKDRCCVYPSLKSPATRLAARSAGWSR